MEHVNTTHLELKKDGWELLVNEKKELLLPKIGDIVKIEIEMVSPLDFEKDEIRSVSHETFWVQIEKEEADGYIGSLKTNPSHDLEIKNGTKFAIGDKIFIKEQNILAIR